MDDVSRFFFYRTATTEIYTLSLHDALPISPPACAHRSRCGARSAGRQCSSCRPGSLRAPRSEEHTSELQSRGHLVCRLLLEKNKITRKRLSPTPYCPGPLHRTHARPHISVV